MSSRYQPNKSLWLNYWRGIYAMPHAWAMKGENLVHAFETVAAASVEGSMNFDMGDQALMLAGMGIEVMLKALIVENAHTRNLVSRGCPRTPAAEKKLWYTFYSHDIVALGTLAGLALSTQQTEVAEVLSEYIYWRGRYVMPKESGIEHIIPIKHDKGPVGPPDRPVTNEEVKELIDHVIAEVHRRLQNKA